MTRKRERLVMIITPFISRPLIRAPFRVLAFFGFKLILFLLQKFESIMKMKEKLIRVGYS